MNANLVTIMIIMMYKYCPPKTACVILPHKGTGIFQNDLYLCYLL